jgi:hypothetical protein
MTDRSHYLDLNHNRETNYREALSKQQQMKEYSEKIRS